MRKGFSEVCIAPFLWCGLFVFLAFRWVCEALCAVEKWIAELFEPGSALHRGAEKLDL